MKTKRSITWVFFMISLCAGLFILGSCTSYTYRFDITRDETYSIRGDTGTREIESVATAPFCQFSKYEITVYYVHIAFYEVNGKGYSRHTVVNRNIDNGIKINLAKEKLSDKIPADELLVTNAKGDAVEKIWIGLGDDLVINGYIYRNGALYHTTAGGFAAGGGTPAEMKLPAVGGELIPAWEFPEESPDQVPIIEDLHGVYLILAAGGHVVGNDDVTLHDLGTLEFRFPIDVGIVNNGAWQSCNVGAGTPFIDESTVYEKYYLKRIGEPYYTDMMKMLFDKRGRLINGQCWGYSFDGGNYAKNIFGTHLHNTFHIWFDCENLELYNSAFGINPDGSIYLDSRVGWGAGDVYIPAFVRASHSGYMTVWGKPVNYECLKVE